MFNDPEKEFQIANEFRLSKKRISSSVLKIGNEIIILYYVFIHDYHTAILKYF